MVKYLGLNMDKRGLLNAHIDIQLNKAKTAWKMCGKLFFNSNLNARVKLICYQLLIRPILTYACSLWYNLSSTMMEKLRSIRKTMSLSLSQYVSI